MINESRNVTRTIYSSDEMKSILVALGSDRGVHSCISDNEELEIEQSNQRILGLIGIVDEYDYNEIDLSRENYFGRRR